ncbi:MAG: alanine dehydrogenase [Flavobacteriales bacterium]|nr:MAG: alanine dehydrogenase [Flavobacteriales bacterium]
MSNICIGIIREGKTPPDKRVPFTPEQAAQLQNEYGISVIVEPSEIRAYSDDDYRNAGCVVQKDLSKCDILMGVKEVPIRELIPNKTYFFFSHTIKEQPYNRKLLQAVLKSKIRLIDYEVLTKPNGVRVVGFGRYAGIVGAYNGLLAFGKASGRFKLRPANECFDRAEMNAELKKINLPSTYKIVLTGTGRVAKGAREVLIDAGLAEVSPLEFVDRPFQSPVFTVLEVNHYFFRKDNQPFDKRAFYADPADYEARFMSFARVADMYIPCHYWDSRSPFIFTKEIAQSPENRIKIVADVSCDIDGPIASTLRPSTIDDPLYGYDPASHTEVPFGTPNSIGVMAVDNLPCELPRDASRDFGVELINSVIPALLNNDEDELLERASITTREGHLGKYFQHLKNYAELV